MKLIQKSLQKRRKLSLFQLQNIKIQMLELSSNANDRQYFFTYITIVNFFTCVAILRRMFNINYISCAFLGSWNNRLILNNNEKMSSKHSACSEWKTNNITYVGKAW